MPYNCVHCSFEHLHPVTRCNMCERVQFDKEDVSNFVRGGATKRQLQLGSRSSSPRAPEQPVVVPIAPPGSKAPPPGSSALLSGDVKQAIEAKRLAALERQRNKGQEMGRPSVPLSGQAARPPSRVPPARPPPKNLYARPPPPKNLYARPPPPSQPYARPPPPANLYARPPQSNQQRYARPPPPSSMYNRMMTNTERLPASHVPGVFEPGPVPFDKEAIKTWQYPTNYSVRKYQNEMAKTALFHNTIVALPTGLGKTLIASVVIHNFHRWFPTGICIFVAPTKPLVRQQIQVRERERSEAPR